jgi:thiamine biosynthesis lipoprotein
VVAERRHLVATEALARRILNTIDLACSRFRADSDLSAVNAAAGDWVRVNPLLVAAVDVALEAAGRTHGLVDPTLGRRLVELGYDRDLTEAAGSTDPTAVPAPVPFQAWRQVRTDPRGAIRIPAGVSLDLGATGKAFAADLIASQVARDIGTDLIISVGGDVAIGAVEPDASPHSWLAEVAETPTATVDERLILEHGGLATSGVLNRRWRSGHHVVHHVLDPRTGTSVTGGWRTVSVIGPDCTTANTASTAALVMGPGAESWLTGQNLAARLVTEDGDVIRTAGWPGIER